MASYSVDAIVLSRRDIGEADRLLTIFSRSMGKQRVVAKGTRRISSRMAAHLEPGRESTLFLIERRSLPLITQVEPRRVFTSYSADLTELKDLFSILEVTANLLDDGQRDSRLYDLVTTTLIAFKKTTGPKRQLLLVAYFLKALKLLGLAPQLDRCIGCGKTLEASGQPTVSGKFYLSVVRGGVLHQECGNSGPGTFVVSAEAILSIRKLEQGELATIPTDLAPASELLRPIQAFVEWHSERSLKSAQL